MDRLSDVVDERLSAASRPDFQKLQRSLGEVSGRSCSSIQSTPFRSCAGTDPQPDSRVMKESGTTAKNTGSTMSRSMLEIASCKFRHSFRRYARESVLLRLRVSLPPQPWQAPSGHRQPQSQRRYFCLGFSLRHAAAGEATCGKPQSNFGSGTCCARTSLHRRQCDEEGTAHRRPAVSQIRNTCCPHCAWH